MTGRTDPRTSFARTAKRRFGRSKREAIARIMAERQPGGQHRRRRVRRSATIATRCATATWSFTCRCGPRRWSIACATAVGPPRPLLESPDPLEQVMELMEQRKEAYSAAHVTIGVDGRSRYELVGELTRRFLAWQRQRRPRADAPDDRSRPAGCAPGGRAGAAAGRAGRWPSCPRRWPKSGFAGRLFVVADEYALELHGARLARGPARGAAAGHLGRRSEQDARAGQRGLGLAGRPRRAAARRGGRLRRRRGVRPGRLRRGVLPARHRPGQRADDAAGAGRRGRRRQDRRQSPARQEPDRRVLPAAVRRRRHELAGVAVAARLRGGHGRSRQDGHDSGRRPVRVGSKRRSTASARATARRWRRSWRARSS